MVTNEDNAMKKSGFLHYLDLLGKYTSLTFGALAGVLVFLMVLLIIVDVVGRSTTGWTTQIADEVSAFALVAIVFIGLAHTQRMGRHIEIHILIKKFSKKTQERLHLAALILALAIIGWLAWLTLDPVVVDYVNNTKSLGIARIPMWIPRLFIPLGASLFGLELLIEIIKKLTKTDGLTIESEEVPLM